MIAQGTQFSALIILWVCIGVITIAVLVKGLITSSAKRSRRNKITDEDALLYALKGYYMFKSDNDPNVYIISDGKWGTRAAHLVFIHKSTHAPLEKAIACSDVKNAEIFTYDISESIFEENKEADMIFHGISNYPDAPTSGRKNPPTGIAIIDAMERYLTNTVDKMHEKENVCRITCKDGDQSFFYYKNTRKNTATVEKIREHIFSNKPAEHTPQ